jgi:hypothetical protein
MSDPKPLVKIGAGDYGTQTPVRYADVWLIESTTGPNRLKVGSSDGHIDELLSLPRIKDDKTDPVSNFRPSSVGLPGHPWE